MDADIALGREMLFTFSHWHSLTPSYWLLTNAPSPTCISPFYIGESALSSISGQNLGSNYRNEWRAGQESELQGQVQREF